MKIERINENQIRCTLTSADLSVRNLNLVELAYGTEKARKLFREMIQRASSEVGFEADDIPLMVEAIPLSSESIMLVITKIEDPEELDTRFSKFTPPSEDTPESLISQPAGQLLEGADQIEAGPGMNLIPGPPDETPEQTMGERTPEPPVATRIFRFDSLDRVCDGARAVGTIYQGDNSLYKKPGTRQYYLVMRRQGCEDLEFSRGCNILAEYGTKLPGEQAVEAYLKEHYETMILSDALQNLQKI